MRQRLCTVQHARYYTPWAVFPCFVSKSKEHAHNEIWCGGFRNVLSRPFHIRIARCSHSSTLLRKSAWIFYEGVCNLACCTAQYDIFCRGRVRRGSGRPHFVREAKLRAKLQVYTSCYLWALASCASWVITPSLPPLSCFAANFFFELQLASV